MAKAKIDIIHEEVEKLIVALNANGIDIKKKEILTSLGIDGHIVITLKGDLQ